MPSYRNTSQIAIMASINDARALLEYHCSGPALAQHLARISDDAISAIGNARDDNELAKAIRDSRIEDNFIYIAKLLRFHAEADTDGKGLEIYKNLAKWGGFTGARGMSRSALDEEVDGFISSQPESILKTAAFNAAAVDTRINAVTAFKAYVIEISGLKEGRIRSSDPALESMCEEILRLYGDNPEFKRVMIGAVSSDANARCGIVFIATAPMAVQIANTHESLNVYSSTGAHIPPARNKPTDLMGMPYDI